MIKNMVCIDCPNGCNLSIEVNDGILKVEGNRCKRGIAFAEAEMFRPVRTISSTVRTVFKDVPVAPVRTDKPFDKSRIFEVMREINKLTLDKRVKRNDILIKDVLGTGANIIVTSDILNENK